MRLFQLAILGLLLAPADASARASGPQIHARSNLISLAKSIQIKADYGHAISISSMLDKCESEKELIQTIESAIHQDAAQFRFGNFCTQRSEYKYYKKFIVISIETFKSGNCDAFRSTANDLFLLKRNNFSETQFYRGHPVNFLTASETREMIDRTQKYYDISRSKITCDENKYYISVPLR